MRNILDAFKENHNKKTIDTSKNLWVQAPISDGGIPTEKEYGP